MIWLRCGLCLWLASALTIALALAAGSVLDAGQLLYAAPDAHFNSHIYLYDLRTGIAAQLTYGEAEDSFPSWSPDGEEIVFSSRRRDDGVVARNVYVMSAAGRDLRLLLPGLNRLGTLSNYPAWSPDSGQLAYTILQQPGGEQPRTSQIFVVHRGMQTVQAVTEGDVVRWNVPLRWHAGENEVRFIYVLPDELVAYGAAPGRGLRELNAWRGDDINAFAGFDFFPVLSPDAASFLAGASADGALYYFPLDGTHPERFSRADERVSSAPVWSADGRYAAYTVGSTRSSATPPALIITDAATRTHQTLTGAPAMVPESWSPDGRRLLLRAADGQGIYCILQRSDGALNCPGPGFGIHPPRWRPLPPA